jgi:hypothetical protein
MATCYQKLGMLEECVEYLVLATRSLDVKIACIENEEEALLFSTGASSNKTAFDNQSINNFSAK